MLPFHRALLTGGGADGAFDLISEVATAGGALYDPSSLWGAADHLPRRNLLTYSEDFSNAAWLALGVTKPTASRIQETTANSLHFAYQTNLQGLAGVTYKFSIEVAIAERNNAVFGIYTGTDGIININLTTGLKTGYLGTDVSTYTVEDVGSGWFRLSMTRTIGASTISNMGISVGCANGDGNLAAYAGDASKGISVRNASLMRADTIDQSYQKTTDWVTEQFAWAAQKNVPWLRRNRFLNTATLSTQTVSSVTAKPLTVSFTGTGTITFSTAHTGTLVGTGASNRVSTTFTPSAGNLVCTVSGSVTLAQCEVGSTATPYQEVGASWDAQYAANAAAAGVALTMFQDSAGTAAVSGPDLPIGKLNDLSGNGYHAIQATASLKPVLRISANGGWYIQRDMSDDNLVATFPNLGSSCVEYIAGGSSVAKTEGVTLNGAKSMSTPATDYGRVYLPAPSRKDAQITSALQAKIK